MFTSNFKFYLNFKQKSTKFSRIKWLEHSNDDKIKNRLFFSKKVELKIK